MRALCDDAQLVVRIRAPARFAVDHSVGPNHGANWDINGVTARPPWSCNAWFCQCNGGGGVDLS